MKPKFKAGDRVIAVDAKDTLLLEVGMTGTVVDYDQTIFAPSTPANCSFPPSQSLLSKVVKMVSKVP